MRIAEGGETSLICETVDFTVVVNKGVGMGGVRGAVAHPSQILVRLSPPSPLLHCIYIGTRISTYSVVHVHG